jgi:SAM-dependent methyltransferase
MKPPDRPLIRIRLEGADLRAAWEHHAAEFVAWARAPDHDSYPQFHRELFLPLVPPPGRRTLDLGCGEGRASRDLKEMGHHVIGVDVSATMLTAARVTDPSIDTCLADAARLPFGDRSFDCVIAFMSLQDVDEMATAIMEAARVLETGGRLCLAIVHPLNSAGRFAGDEPDSPFTIEGSLSQAFVLRGQRRSRWLGDDLRKRPSAIVRIRAGHCRFGPPDRASARAASSRARDDKTAQQPLEQAPMFLHLRALKP